MLYRLGVLDFLGRRSVALPLCAFIALTFCCNKSSGADVVLRTFREVDTMFANPGQGWMSQQRTPRGEPRFPCSVVYVRFDWSMAEPEEGNYNWKIIDDVIAAWASRNATVGLRVMTCNAHSAGYYSSPKWLFDSGCKGHEYLRGGDDPTSGGKRIPRIEPDYADPVYLEKHGAFLKALGARYDGHAAIEFLDIGSYGIWGEWHTPHPASVEVRKQIVDLYLNAFKKTSLVFMSDDAQVLSYALSRGTGFRRDGVGSPWHEQNWIGSKKYAAVEGMADVWKRAPVVFEWFGNFDYLQSKSWSFDAAVEFMLRNHVTLINDNIGHVPPDAMPQLEKLARLAGARLALRKLEHAESITAGATLELRMNWTNAGVGKLYRPYALSLSLDDAQGRRVHSVVGKSSAQSWLPGEHQVTESLTVPATIVPGAYTLRVALVSPATNRPPFRLAMDASEKDGWYEVSKVKVQAALPARVDLRPEFKRFNLSQRRQGERGTCSVFATVEAIEFAVARAAGNAPRLSVEFANWAANEATRRNDDGDFFHSIIRGVEKFGICEEAAMPYQGAFAPTNRPSQQATTQANKFQDEMELSFRWIRDWTRKPGLNDEDLRQIRAVLANGFPVSAGSYHSVLFVGYEDNPELPGGGRFLVSDSNLVERDISYEAAKKRMCDLFWVRAQRKRQTAANTF